MAHKEKIQKNNRMRKPVNITLPEECIAFVRENGINLSQFVEMAIKNFISEIETHSEREIVGLVLFSQIKS
ncbi:type II toxin-antitoxin system CcdA family antitoxin [Methanorbis furvi]|uniref:Uncharacterized protein n=1 Tax=Methanorbis furvi TaxID=3028299 RepID=A0AAE4SAV1_9EURY|nr:hypothetical protein [Methanocorpusculaceae archaeon Ag1]